MTLGPGYQGVLLKTSRTAEGVINYLPPSHPRSHLPPCWVTSLRTSCHLSVASLQLLQRFLPPRNRLVISSLFPTLALLHMWTESPPLITQYCKDHDAIFKTNKQKPLSSEGLVIGKKKRKIHLPSTHTHTHPTFGSGWRYNHSKTPWVKFLLKVSLLAVCFPGPRRLAETSWLGAEAYTISRLWQRNPLRDRTSISIWVCPLCVDREKAWATNLPWLVDSV